MSPNSGKTFFAVTHITSGTSVILEVGLPMSKFQVDSMKKMDLKFGFSIESYATIQKFKLIGAMKLFCGHLKIVVFCKKNY